MEFGEESQFVTVWRSCTQNHHFGNYIKSTRILMILLYYTIHLLRILTLWATELILAVISPAELGMPSSKTVLNIPGGLGFNLGGGLIISSLTALVTFSGTILLRRARSSSGGRSLNDPALVVTTNSFDHVFQNKHIKYR